MQVLAAVDQDFSIADKREIMHVACRMMHVSEDDFNAMVPPPEEEQEAEQEEGGKDDTGNKREPKQPEEDGDSPDEEEGGGPPDRTKRKTPTPKPMKAQRRDGEGKENE